MRGKLVAVAVTGFAISAVCLGGAFALGGEGVGNTLLDVGNFGQPRCDVTGSSGGASRSLPWNGLGDRVAIDFAADTIYRAGSGDQLIVRGDPAVISHVFVRDGVVGIDCRHNGSFFRDTPRIEVTLPGRAFRTFEQRSSGDMRITGLSQPDAKLAIEGSGNIQADGKVERLSVRVAGSGDITATGSAGALDVDLQGSGNVSLGGLVTKSAHVEINGSGNVEIAPRDASRVDIAGSGSGDFEATGTADSLTVAVQGSGDMNLGSLVANSVNVNVRGSGNVEIAPRDALKVDIAGSGNVTLRNEPTKIETQIVGSGDIIHVDGTRQTRHSRERHARADDDLGVVIDRAVANGTSPDHDELERAKAKLKARIRHQVAQALAGDDQP
jgi:Putative auto-transporter adhesin, head GIN domain